LPAFVRASARPSCRATIDGVGRAVELRLGEALARVGLSLAKVGALTHLVEAGEPLSQGECAKKMTCVRSNITQLTDWLEADKAGEPVCERRDVWPRRRAADRH
jgi:hypothetical protein